MSAIRGDGENVVESACPAIGSQMDQIAANVVVAIQQHPSRHHIHPAAEQFAQGVLKADHVEQRAPPVELDKEVDVAAKPILATGHRAEHCDRPTLVTRRQRDDLVSVPLNE